MTENPSYPLPHEALLGRIQADHPHGPLRRWTKSREGNTHTAQIQEEIFRIHTLLAAHPGTRVEGAALAQLFEGYHTILDQSQNGELSHKDAADVLSYSIGRLVPRDNVVSLGKKAVICLTDDVGAIMGSDRKVPMSRARLCTHDSETNTLTFLLRSSRPDNNTDVHEILSLLGNIELVKKKIQIALAENDDDAIAKYRKVLKTTSGKDFTHQELIDWSSPENSLTLTSPTEPGKLRLPWDQPNIEHTAAGYTAQVIAEALTREGLETEGLFLGNDFSLPLIIASGALTDADVCVISREITKSEVQLVDAAMLDSLGNPDQAALVKRYAYMQYINRYRGDNSSVQSIKQRLEQVIDSFRIRLVKPQDSPLGSYIDVIDFSKIDQAVCDNIQFEEFRQVIADLRESEAKILQTAYPLGDSTDSLIRGLDWVEKKYDIKIMNKRVGFFGKVGAVVDAEQIVRIGRVADAETAVSVYAATSDMQPEEFPTFVNDLLHDDYLIIPAPDRSEVLVCVDSVLLQTRADHERIRAYYAQRLGMDLSQVTILLDMESIHLQRICRELEIDPSEAYYISDKTELTPNGGAPTLAKGLGAAGTLASLVTCISVLRKMTLRGKSVHN